MQYKWTALIVTSLGTLMAAIDARIVIISIPTIAEQLHAGAEEVVWINQSYLLASTIGLLVFGRISDIFGKVKIFKFGFVVFTIGSLASTLAENSFQLIGFRTVQGVGAAILMTVSVAIVTDSSERRELGRMIGFTSVSWRVGSIAGLTLSGIVLAITSWRGLFFINVPIGILGITWAQISLRDHSSSTTTAREKMDWLGAGLLSFGLTMILLAITFLTYGTNQLIFALGLFVVGSIVIAIFLKIESIVRFPILDLRLFKIGAFSAANLSQLICAFSWGTVLILIAFYLEIGLRFTPLDAGIAITPVEFSYTLFAILGGRLSDKVDTRLISTTGIVVTVIGLLLVSTFNSSTQYIEIALVLATIGAGAGTFTVPNARALMSAVPKERRGVASALWNMMFQTAWTVSYGMVILLLTLGVQYKMLTDLLQGSIAGPNLPLAISQFFVGLRLAALILAGVNCMAVIPSAITRMKAVDSSL